MDLVSPIIDLLKCIMVPMCNHVKHHRILGQRMDILREKMTHLRMTKKYLENRKQTEVRADQEVKEEVEHWLERAEAIITEIQKIEEKFQNVTFMRCGLFSKQVQKKIAYVDKILENGKFPESIAINKPPAMGLILPTERNAEGDQNRVKFREHLEEKIMGYLMGDDVGIIGVCGQGGVGKTTLAKSINNKMSNLKDSKFEKVIWAPLPYPFSIVKLQETIAGFMNENLPDNWSEEARAAKLLEILGKVKFLLILDDAWERFSFEHVGIPVPTAENGCKVVITSRSTQLCQQIGCNNDGLVDVATLSQEESYNLFLDTVGRDDVKKIPNLEDTLRGLVQGCAGLPLAIVVIARSMRGENDISGWRNALNELRKGVESVRGWDDEIFERLKFSYHRLNNEEFQNCFLFCSLYGKSAEIKKEMLMECWIDGGLIKKLKTRKVMTDRASAILNRLISDCLIEEYSNQHVRMHDVIRDMALRVAGSRFLVKVGEQVGYITENGDWTEHLEKVSMIESGISEISSDFRPNCPKLSTLLVSSNYDLRMIPDSFFKGMPSLTYLDLSYTSISDLPNSVSNLKNLTTLLLRHMYKLKYVPSLAELKALKKLDLRDTGIEVVPEGLEALVNLQYLDLLCPYLVEFPIQILKDLSHLEFLAANFSSHWSNIDSVIEAKQMRRLNMFEAFIGAFYNLEGLNKYVKFFHQHQKPTQYLLTVGEVNVVLRNLHSNYAWSSIYQTTEASKKVVLARLDFQEKQVLLPNDLQQLKIRECYGVESLSGTSFLYTETDLRSCKIAYSSFQCILDLGSPSSICNSLFDKCEVLDLFRMGELRVLVKGVPQATTALQSTSHASLSTPPSIFSNIKRFQIHECPRIKKLFSSNLLMGLQNLEEIHVLDCGQMEEIIKLEEEGIETLLTGGNNETTVPFNLAKLRKLVLGNLPRLKSICTAKGVMVCDSIQIVDIRRCPRLYRIPLYLPLSSPPPSLQEIKLDSRETWEMLKWDNPTTKEILLPFFKPYPDAPSLYWEFDDLKEFNNFVSCFHYENLTSYEFIVKAQDDNDDHGSSEDKDGGDEEDRCGNSDDSFYYEEIIEIDRDSSKMVALHGVQVNINQAILLPDGLQCLEIINCGGMRSLCELKTDAVNLSSCMVKQCGELECMLDVLPPSSNCKLLDGFQSLMLIELPNFQVLVRMENQATQTPSTSRVLKPTSIFSNLKHFVLTKCPKIKKLFPSELLIGLQNLEKIDIDDCAELEEIIQGEEGENETITFTLPKLKQLILCRLPKLKRICIARGVMVCNSLEILWIDKCSILERIPLHLPLLPNRQPSPPPLLKEIVTDSTEWWESLQWDKPTAKDILSPFLKV